MADSRSSPTGLYGQELELEICVRSLAVLGSRAAIDVGAERGGLTAPLREAGFAPVVAIEPHPGNAAALRERFAGDPDVAVVEAAASDVRGPAALRLAHDAAGEAAAYHTLEVREDAADVGWDGSCEVERVLLGDLVADGRVPAHVGLLKVDTEGHDLAVLRGLGELRCDIVMVETWRELPRTLGVAPYSADDLAAVLAPRGLSAYAFVRHTPEGSAVQWNAVEMRVGDWGNLLFVHDSVLDGVQPVVMDAMAHAQTALLERLHGAEETAAELEVQRSAATARLTLIEELSGEIERTRDAGGR